MKPTIIDVAKKAGVSIATVSRVLNKIDVVNDKTRERVLNVINELNYIINEPARQLRTNKTHTIGVLIPDITNSFFTEIIKGIQAKANDSHYRLIIFDISNIDNLNHVDKEKEYIRYIYNGNVDGIILMYPQLSFEAMKSIKNNYHKVVVFGFNTEKNGIQSISVDNLEGAYEATYHLCSHGYKRIAYIGGNEFINEKIEIEPDRLKGFKKALNEYNLEIRPEYLENGFFSETGGGNAFLRLLQLPEPPQAIFCSNDEMALGVLTIAKKRNIRVPQDIALVGYDNIRISQFTNPPLTSINQPKYNIGILLCEKIIYSINNKDSNYKFKNLSLKPELIIRNSCGC